MNPLLQQFLTEARDFLQTIGEKLLQLEKAPTDAPLIAELFRVVHTLKGNSGLFEFPEMTRVLHAAEDLMDAVRNDKLAYSRELADSLLDAMDFVSMLCDEIEVNGSLGGSYTNESTRLSESLRKLQAVAEVPAEVAATPPQKTTASENTSISLPTEVLAQLQLLPENERMQAYRLAIQGAPLHWIVYTPHPECFFQGEDPFFQAQQTPELLWGSVVGREPWPKLLELDAYHCNLEFYMLSAATEQSLQDYFRYMAEHTQIHLLSPLWLIVPAGDLNGGPVYDDFVNDALALLQAGDLQRLTRIAETMLELSSPDLWLASALRWLLLILELAPQQQEVLQALLESISSLQPIAWDSVPSWPLANTLAADIPAASLPAEQATPASPDAPLSVSDDAPLSTKDTEIESSQELLLQTIAMQQGILNLPLTEAWSIGRMQAAAKSLGGCLHALGAQEHLPALEQASAQALAAKDTAPLLEFIAQFLLSHSPVAAETPTISSAPSTPSNTAAPNLDAPAAALDHEPEVKFNRRSEDNILGAKSLKVDQAKIDRLMNLIGEMVVSKNALPYLAGRAESVYQVRELAREIKAQYAVINRIAEEMQDAIMQVRMMPVSFVFQRFPRLVRDISRRLGKEVNLVLEGEDTEADKNIIEALGDPLIHIIRNSLDHGFELPEVRRNLGKPAVGTLCIRAIQQSDRVIIEIQDDGKGIDPEVIKRKAYAKGLLDEAALERISDQDAIHLIFAPGFSTAEVVSDLSGRGVGMDVVRTAIENVNGVITLESTPGKGTLLQLSLPLSMAVTNVMLIESHGLVFGVPMDNVVETVRIARSQIRSIKHAKAAVLRGSIVPIKALNDLLCINSAPKANADDELAVLVVRFGHESVGLLVDNFRETVDIILKPMNGVLAELSVYSGSALMGDGSVLMVLNIKELLQ